MKKILIFAGIIFVLIIIWLGIRFILGGLEDDWICVNNQWVKHGNPSGPKPTGICSQNSHFLW